MNDDLQQSALLHLLSEIRDLARENKLMSRLAEVEIIEALMHLLLSIYKGPYFSEGDQRVAPDRLQDCVNSVRDMPFIPQAFKDYAVKKFWLSISMLIR